MGSKSGRATTDNGVILTVPQGSTWIGSVTLSASVSAGTSSSAVTASPYVTVEGGDLYFASGDIVHSVSLATPAVNALSLLGVSSSTAATVPKITLYATSDDVQLKLHTSGATVANAVAVGDLL